MPDIDVEVPKGRVLVQNMRSAAVDIPGEAHVEAGEYWHLPREQAESMALGAGFIPWRIVPDKPKHPAKEMTPPDAASTTKEA